MKKLYINDKPAVKGQEVTTFRGEKLTLTGWREPHKPSSTGRVFVTGNYVGEFFPSVIGGEFREENENEV
jgi:hypothetical protein